MGWQSELEHVLIGSQPQAQRLPVLLARLDELWQPPQLHDRRHRGGDPTITSSPGLIRRAYGSLAEMSAEIANMLALELEFTSSEWGTHRKAESSF